MSGTPILAHPFQRGSLFDGGVHGIRGLPLCNNGWTEIFVIGTGMVICPIIPYISVSWQPKVAGFLLAIHASDPELSTN